MKKVALALMLLVGEARAEEKLGISGNDLLEFCQAGEPGLENPARAFCLGYIVGALEGWHHATVMHRGSPSCTIPDAGPPQQPSSSPLSA